MISNHSHTNIFGSSQLASTLLDCFLPFNQWNFATTRALHFVPSHILALWLLLIGMATFHNVHIPETRFKPWFLAYWLFLSPPTNKIFTTPKLLCNWCHLHIALLIAHGGTTLLLHTRSNHITFKILHTATLLCHEAAPPTHSLACQ